MNALKLADRSKRSEETEKEVARGGRKQRRYPRDIARVLKKAAGQLGVVQFSRCELFERRSAVNRAFETSITKPSNQRAFSTDLNAAIL